MREGSSARLVRHQLDQTDVNQPMGSGNAASTTRAGTVEKWGTEPRTASPPPLHQNTTDPHSLETNAGRHPGEILPPVQPTIDPIENNDKIGRMGHTHGLYLLCSIKVHPCWVLVDTGSTISIVRPRVLPETGWTPTDCKIRTVTGELAGMLGKLPLPVKVGNTETTHNIWGAEILDPCIIGLDLRLVGGLGWMRRGTPVTSARRC